MTVLFATQTRGHAFKLYSLKELPYVGLGPEEFFPEHVIN